MKGRVGNESRAPPQATEALLRRSRLERRLDEVTRRRLGLIVADAGFGKSTLVAAWAGERNTAWHALSGRDRHLEQLARGIVGALRIAVPGLPDELARALQGDRGPDADLEASERAQVFASMVCAALEVSLDRDLVLVLDELDELESGPGLELVEGLCRQAGPHLHLVLVSRTEPPFAIDRLRGQGQVTDLRGRDLLFSPAETAALVASALGREQPELARNLHEQTDGWPAAVTIALEALRLADPDQRPALLDDLRSSGSPLLEYLAGEVFEREQREVRDLIRAAAALESISPQLCADLGLEHAEPALGRLARRGLLVTSDPNEPGWFALTQLGRDLIRVHYPLATVEERNLRARAATWLNASGRAEAALRLFRASGDLAGLSRLLAERGEALIAGGAVEAVIEAGEFLPADGRDPAIERVVGTARQIRGDWEGAVACFRRAMGDGETLDPGLAWRLGLIHHFRGELDQAEEVYERADPMAGPPSDRAALLAWHAALDWLRGRVEQCRDRAIEALSVATDAESPTALASAHTVLAMLAALEGDRTANDAHYLRALEYAERAGDVLQVIRVRANRGSRFLEEGSYTAALSELEIALRLADVAGFAFFRALALSNRGQARFMIGRFEEARTDLEQSKQIWERLGSHNVAYPLAILADIDRERGALALARAGYEEARDHAEAAGDVQGLVPALSGLARVLAAEDVELARAPAKQALDAGTGLGYVAALLSTGWVELAGGEAGRAAELAADAAATARKRRDRAGLAEALELQSRTVDDAPALALLTQAISIWEKIESPVGAARAELAAAMVASPPDAEGHLDRAERTVRRIGAHAYSQGLADAHSELRAQARAPVRILTLGRFQVLRRGVAVPLSEWQSKKARDVLKILIARRGRPTQRELLMEALWPKGDPAKVGNRLSVALSTAAGVLDPERRGDQRLIVAEGETVAVGLEAVEVDLEDFLAEAEAGLALARQGRSQEAVARLVAAEALYSGDFLEEDAYQDWAAPMREEARATYITVARALADDAVARGEAELAERYLLRLLEKDAFDESAHLALVGNLAAARRHGDARRAYRRYAARMREIGVEAAPFPTP